MKHIVTIILVIFMMTASASVALAHNPDHDTGELTQNVVTLPFFNDGRGHYEDPDALIGVIDGQPILLLMVAAESELPTTINIERAPDDVRSFPVEVSFFGREHYPSHHRVTERLSERYDLSLKLALAIVRPESRFWQHIGDPEVTVVYLGDPEAPVPFGGLVSDVAFETGGTLTLYHYSADNGWRSWLEVMAAMPSEPYDYQYGYSY